MSEPSRTAAREDPDRVETRRRVLPDLTGLFPKEELIEFLKKQGLS
jgi:hypothetical protein